MDAELLKEDLKRKERQIYTLINISKILEKERDDFEVVLNKAAALFTEIFENPKNISVNIKVSDFEAVVNNFIQENIFIEVPVNYNEELLG